MKISKNLLEIESKMSKNLLESKLDKYEYILRKSGFYNKLFYIIICIIYFISFVLGMVGYSIPYYLYQVKLSCTEISTNKVIDCYDLYKNREYKTFNELRNQNKYNYSDNIKFDNLSSQFQLYYDRKGIYDLIKSLLYLGGSLVCFLFSFIADSFGKKVTIILSIVLSIVGSFILLFYKSLNLYFAIFLYILMFAGYDYFYNISFIYISEISRYRKKLNYLAYSYGFCALGGLLINLYTLSNINLTYIDLIICFSLFISILFSLFIYESPIYLIVKKRKDDLINLFKKINKFSKSSNSASNENIKEIEEYYNTFDIIEDNNKQEELEIEINIDKRHPIVIIFTKKNILVRFVVSMIYFSLVYIIFGMTIVCIEELGTSNIHINGSVLSILEGLGYVINVPLSNKVKRKKYLIYNTLCIFLLSLVLLSLSSFKNNEVNIGFFSYLFIIISGLIKFIISGIITLKFIYISELFPTKIRIIACGMILFVARGFTFFSPILSEFGKKLNIQILIIPSFMLASSLFLFKFLPETKLK